jgi:hypothetical protein
MQAVPEQQGACHGTREHCPDRGDALRPGIVSSWIRCRRDQRRGQYDRADFQGANVTRNGALNPQRACEQDQ